MLVIPTEMSSELDLVISKRGSITEPCNKTSGRVVLTTDSTQTLLEDNTKQSDIGKLDSPSTIATESSDRQSTNHAIRRKNWSQKRHISMLCLASVLPMILFTAIIIGLVFRYRVTAHQCAFPEFCSQGGLDDDVDYAKYYYVDFPAAQLVFIASWSSTVRKTYAHLTNIVLTRIYSSVSRFLDCSWRCTPMSQRQRFSSSQSLRVHVLALLRPIR